LITGDKYVGSSSKLAKRLQGYFHGTHESVGKFIPLLKLEGLSQFKLEVIPLTESYFVNQELAIEQYFILHPEYNLNTAKVVNSFSGARGKPLYMYNKDLSNLIFYSDILEDFIFKLGIHHTTITKCLKNGELYLDEYILSEKPILTAKEIELSIGNVCSLLDIARSKIQSNKGRKIIITSTSNLDDVKTFDSLKACISYLDTIAPSNNSTLYRHIESGEPYHGYICKFLSDKTIALADKNIQVSVTHVSTNITIIYSSFRKAALSLAPKYITSGQTLAAYADTGKLFKDEYKIERKNGAIDTQIKIDKPPNN
jgi:hypothetical protein